QLVGHRGVDLGDAQFGRALLDHGAGARGDEGDLDAEAAQQHQALAVVDVEGFALAPGGVEAQAAVGQRAVDVEAGQADAGGCVVDVGHQTTRARSRSWMFSAPTRRPPSSTTSKPPILCVSISRAASTASASGPMV